MYVCVCAAILQQNKCKKFDKLRKKRNQNIAKKREMNLL